MGAKFEGKRLLVLGSSTGSVDIVEYARGNGARVTVADYLDPRASAAKLAADSALNVSTADADALADYVRSQGVDGVLAGISGFNILKAMEVSERCGLRFYCNMEQWNRMEVKDGFRELCELHGVPCPRTYYVGGKSDGVPWGSLGYPVVVKPVDSGASRGVFICGDESELRSRFPEALSQSPGSRVILESFERGDEFTAHYVVRRGRARLVCMDDRYPAALHEGVVTTVPIARVYPSEYLDRYLEHVDAPMTRLVESLGLEDAVCFVQGLYDKEQDRFSLFEGGMRSAAELPNRLIAATNGNDYMHLLVDMALNGESDYDLALDDPTFGGRACAIVSLAATGGIVGSITGLEEVCGDLDGVVSHECRYPIGSRIPEGDTLSQLMIRYAMVCDAKEELASKIAFLNRSVSVLDCDGKDMVVRFDPARLAERHVEARRS